LTSPTLALGEWHKCLLTDAGAHGCESTDLMLGDRGAASDTFVGTHVFDSPALTPESRGPFASTFFRDFKALGFDSTELALNTGFWGFSMTGFGADECDATDLAREIP